MKNYDDIINLPRPISKNHLRMSDYNRAAQFSPFAALTGYKEAIESVEETLLFESLRQESSFTIEEEINNVD